MTQPSVLADRLVLIFGCPRSGTTWLTHLLLGHPGAGGQAHSESSLFVSLQTFAGFLERRSDGPLAFVDEPTLVAALRRFCDELLSVDLPAGASVARVVEKTPSHALLLPFINLLYPDAWYIHIVRDGRDVVRSSAEVEFGEPDVAVAARGWVQTLDTVERDAPRLARFREVRYEDLLADPVGRTSDLLSWIGLDVDDDTRSGLAERAGVRVSQYNTTGSVGAGKWRSLDDRQLAAVYRVAGETLIARGYVERVEVDAVLDRAGR
jgi:hypothetical protein